MRVFNDREEAQWCDPELASGRDVYSWGMYMYMYRPDGVCTYGVPGIWSWRIVEYIKNWREVGYSFGLCVLICLSVVLYVYLNGDEGSGYSRGHVVDDTSSIYQRAREHIPGTYLT